MSQDGNSTISESTPVLSDLALHNASFVLRGIEVGSATVIGASILALLVFISHEQKRAKAPFRNALNPFNISLILMGVSLTGLQIATVFHYLLVEQPTADVDMLLAVYVLQECFTYSSQYCYMVYSWNRGAAVIRHVFPQGAVFFLGLVVATPFIFIASTAIDAYDLFMILSDQNTSDVFSVVWFIMAFVPGAMVIVYDITILVTFIKFTVSTKFQGEVDTRFMIVSRFGIVATIFTMATFSVYVLLSATVQEVFVSRVLVAVLTTLLNCCYFTLVAMKVALFLEGEKKKKSRKEMLDRVLGPDSFPLKRSDVNPLKHYSSPGNETV